MRLEGSTNNKTTAIRQKDRRTEEQTMIYDNGILIVQENNHRSATSKINNVLCR